MNTAVRKLSSEHGGAGVKFLLVMVALFLTGNALINYVPVAYEGESFKAEMETSVVQALASSSRISPVDMVKNRIMKAAKEENIPADMWLEVKPNGNIVQARAIYTKEVGLLPFGMWDYKYQFDHTAIPTGYLVKDGK